jgi:hypothetical protein
MNIQPEKPSPLSPQEIDDFIHKFTTDSKHVLALLTACGVNCIVNGTARNVARSLVVSPRHDVGMVETSGLTIGISQLRTATCAFIDPREFKSTPFASFFDKEVRLEFCLCFMFPQGGVLCLAEVATGELYSAEQGDK